MQSFYGNFFGLKLMMDLNWIIRLVSHPTALVTIVKAKETDLMKSNTPITIEMLEIEMHSTAK
jgi:hypothetical protein